MIPYDSIERLIVDQEVPGSRPGGGTITFTGLPDLWQEAIYFWVTYGLQKIVV